MKYIWQHKNFPDFKFDGKGIIEQVQAFTLQAGELNGLIQGFKPAEREDILLQILLAEAIKTSEIEGEYFSRIDVMSSLCQQLGLHNFPVQNKDSFL